jgi:hypothetical protein
MSIWECIIMLRHLVLGLVLGAVSGTAVADDAGVKLATESVVLRDGQSLTITYAAEGKGESRTSLGVEQLADGTVLHFFLVHGAAGDSLDMRAFFVTAEGVEMVDVDGLGNQIKDGDCDVQGPPYCVSTHTNAPVPTLPGKCRITLTTVCVDPCGNMTTSSTSYTYACVPGTTNPVAPEPISPNPIQFIFD